MSKDKESQIDEATFDTTYYLDPLTCSGCNKKFCHAIRMESDERFCKNCYVHRYGLDEMMEISKAMNQWANLLWEVPFDELTEQQKAEIDFLVKNRNDH